MTTSEWISLGSAVIAVGSLGAMIFFSRRSMNAARASSARADEANRIAAEANAYAKRANDLATGQLELEIRNRITAARTRFEDVSADLEQLVDGRQPAELDERDKRRVKPLRQRQNSAAEEFLNAYQDAATKYLDDKIDRERFKKDYFAEIRLLFEPPTNSFAKFLHPEGTSRFKALWKVYRQWYDLENASAPQ